MGLVLANNHRGNTGKNKFYETFVKSTFLVAIIEKGLYNLNNL